jgi:restriction endonuclease
MKFHFNSALPVEAQNDHNRAYIKLLKVRNSKGCVETKSSLSDEFLRDAEKHKIQCGKAHFKALNTAVVFARSNGHEHFRELL